MRIMGVIVNDQVFSVIKVNIKPSVNALEYGEYAGYREILDKIPFPIGYGIETSMILDIFEKWGLEVIAQVDLDRRIHRNQDTKALGRMAFAILKTFIKYNGSKHSLFFSCNNTIIMLLLLKKNRCF